MVESTGKEGDYLWFGTDGTRWINAEELEEYLQEKIKGKTIQEIRAIIGCDREHVENTSMWW